ncbi:hypothetical protein [Nocardia stercoris]|uniref:DUF8017 domain-containing protein n=1 Tax=Nocardia stercoris TaxID=2483361 RepID=A0A3M2L241_9NOCA|nr:hypothetical protein [Nocardia stercoris]RMI30593.1 hypothetical protein EBN03_21245 [Nocardia stercoris]
MPDNDNWWNQAGAQPEDTPAQTDPTLLAGRPAESPALAPPAAPAEVSPWSAAAQSQYAAPQYGQTGAQPVYGGQGSYPAAAQPGYPGTGSHPVAQPGVPYGYPHGGGTRYPSTPFPLTVSPRRRRRTGPIVAIVAVVVLLVGGGITAAVLASRHHSSTTAAGTTPTTAAAVPGYRPVAVAGTGIGYQVPLGWVVPEADSVTLHGTAATVTGTGKSYTGAAYCPGSAYRTEAMVVPVTGSDLGAAATEIATTAAQAPEGYSDVSGGRLTPPTAFTSTAGISGKRAQVDGSWAPNPPGCTTTTYSVYTFAFPAPDGSGSLVLTILSDRGTADELSADQATKILSTVGKS